MVIIWVGLRLGPTAPVYPNVPFGAARFSGKKCAEPGPTKHQPLHVLVLKIHPLSPTHREEGRMKRGGSMFHGDFGLGQVMPWGNFWEPIRSAPTAHAQEDGSGRLVSLGRLVALT